MKRIAAVAVMLLLLCPALSFAGEVEVLIKDYAFVPQRVTIKPGDTVKWTNRVENQHTTTSGKDGAADGQWTSQRLSKGESFSRTFEKPGEYSYFCVPHSLFKMSGVVEVKE